MLKYFYISLFCIITTGISAQKYTLKGKIQDTDKNNLVGAVAVVLNPSDSLLMGYAVTDLSGSFTLPGLDKGSYTLQITYIGYGTIQKLIELSGDNKTRELGLIVMSQEGKMLETITISADYVPIKITKDTLEFNADAFKTQPNALVEDLLKKLPGVEIDASGGIKVQGEDVKAVTVDGKDFFGKDPKMATRNLPADAVKKVQFFDKKSKTAQFTGIDDGQEEKTINLELKDNKKGGYFGNIMGGYGTADRYEAKAMVNRFSKKSQLSVLGSLNNLNNSGVNVNDYVTMTGSSAQNGLRNNGGSSALPISFGQNNTGEISSITAGLNLNYDLNKKNKLNFSYYLTESKTKLIQNTLTNNFLPSGVLISTKSYDSRSSALNHNFSSTFELKPDSTIELTIINTLAFKTNDDKPVSLDSTLSGARTLLNINSQSQKNTTNSTVYSGQLNYRKRLNSKGRTYTLDGTYGSNTTTYLNEILSKVYDKNSMLNILKSVFQFQDQNNGNNNYSIGGTYTEPLSANWYLTLSGSRRNNRTDLIKDFFNLNPDNITIRTFNEELSRTFDNTFVYNIAGTNLRLKNDNFISNFGVEFQQSNLTGIPSVGSAINRTFSYFLPKASIDFEKTNIRINYNTSIREPSIDQLQPVVNNSDPLNLYLGNPNLVPEYRHNMRIMYNFFDQFNFRSLFANIRLGYTKNRITTSTVLDPATFIRTQTPLNTDHEATLSANMNYSSPLNMLRAKFRAGVNSSLTNGISFINAVENTIDRWTNGFNVFLENKTKDRIDASISTRWSYNNNVYLNNQKLNSSFINRTYEAYFALFAGKGWTIDSRMEYNIYGQGSFNESTKIKLWQASVSKAFFDNKLTAKIRAFDILNQNQGVNRSASDTNISQSISNTIGRYFMLNITYSLNALGNTSNQTQMNMPIFIQR